MKNIYIQKIRGILIALVIIMHSISISDNNVENLILLFVRNITNIAVPLFLFLAGYFYNFKKYEIDKKYGWNKIKRLIIPLCFWNIFYFITINHFDLKGLLTFSSSNQLYYLVVLIQLIIITPFIKNKKWLRVLLMISTPIYLITYRILLIVFNFSIPLHQFWIFPWALYYIMGLKEKTKEEERKNNYFIILMSLMISFVLYVIEYYIIGTKFSFSQMNIFNLFVCIIIINNLNLNVKEPSKNRISFLSKLGDNSLGIFFIHMLILKVIKKIVGFLITDSLLLTLICSSLTIISSYYIVILTKKILNNKLNKLLGF